jgi:hypothetical protein
MFFQGTTNKNNQIVNIYEPRIITLNLEDGSLTHGKNYIITSNYPDLLTVANNFVIYTNLIKTVGIIPYNTNFTSGFYPNSLIFEFVTPTNINGFSFISGSKIENSLTMWKIEGSLTGVNDNDFFSLYNQDTAFTDTTPTYPSQYYVSPIFSFAPSIPPIELSQLTNVPLIITNTTNINDNNLLTATRNYFNTTYSTTNSSNYNSILTKIYEGSKQDNNYIIYKISVCYTDNLNNYIDYKIPIDPIFNSYTYIKTKYLVNNNTSEKTILEFSFINSSEYNLTNSIIITDTNAVSLPSKDYFLNILRYKYLRFSPKTTFNTYINATYGDQWNSYATANNYPRFMLTQIQFYNGSNILNNNISKILNNRYNYFEDKTTEYNYLINYQNINNLLSIYRNPTNTAIIFDNYYKSYNTFPNTDVIESTFDTQLIFEFNTIQHVDGFSFITGNNINKSLQLWKIEASLDNTNFFTLFEQTLPFTNITPIYPSSDFYVSPIFTFISPYTLILKSQLSILPPLRLNDCVYNGSSNFNYIKNELFPYYSFSFYFTELLSENPIILTDTNGYLLSLRYLITTVSTLEPSSDIPVPPFSRLVTYEGHTPVYLGGPPRGREYDCTILAYKNDGTNNAHNDPDV